MICSIYSKTDFYNADDSKSKCFSKASQNLAWWPFTCNSSEFLYLLNEPDLEVALLMSVQKNDILRCPRASEGSGELAETVRTPRAS